VNRMKRHFLYFVLSLIIFPVLLRAQGSPPHVIAPGVWFLTGDTNGYSNTVIIEMRDYLIVVDANYPGRAHELLDDYEAAFAQAGAVCLRHACTTATMRTATRCGRRRARPRWRSRA
jgi:hypothetical protein